MTSPLDINLPNVEQHAYLPRSRCFRSHEILDVYSRYRRGCSRGVYFVCCLEKSRRTLGWSRTSLEKHPSVAIRDLDRSSKRLANRPRVSGRSGNPPQGWQEGKGTAVKGEERGRRSLTSSVVTDRETSANLHPLPVIQPSTPDS